LLILTAFSQPKSPLDFRGIMYQPPPRKWGKMRASSPDTSEGKRESGGGGAVGRLVIPISIIGIALVGWATAGVCQPQTASIYVSLIDRYPTMNIDIAVGVEKIQLLHKPRVMDTTIAGKPIIDAANNLNDNRRSRQDYITGIAYKASWYNRSFCDLKRLPREHSLSGRRITLQRECSPLTTPFSTLCGGVFFERIVFSHPRVRFDEVHDSQSGNMTLIMVSDQQVNMGTLIVKMDWSVDRDFGPYPWSIDRDRYFVCCFGYHSLGSHYHSLALINPVLEVPNSDQNQSKKYFNSMRKLEIEKGLGRLPVVFGWFSIFSLAWVFVARHAYLNRSIAWGVLSLILLVTAMPGSFVLLAWLDGF
jgi:hypothetical protein